MIKGALAGFVIPAGSERTASWPRTRRTRQVIIDSPLVNTRNQIIDSDTTIAQTLIDNPTIELNFYQKVPLNDIESVKMENWLSALVKIRAG